jgi:hypothetical protein
MKKLMIAAAVAVVGAGAFAVCGDDPTPQVQGRQVYKVVYSGKTTIGLPKAGSTGDCGDEVAGCVARLPGTLKIEGWFLVCDPTCATLSGYSTDDAEAKAFWTTKPYKGDIADGKLALNDVSVIGKKAKDAEASGLFTGTIKFAEAAQWSLGDGLTSAGLGKYTKKTASYSITGNFAGAPTASWYVSSANCDPSRVYDCATLQLKCEEEVNTVAFGKWTLKYDSSATKKALKGTLPKTPSYATVVTAE